MVANRKKLLEIRNEAYEQMGKRFEDTVNDSDSKIDSCIYQCNGILAQKALRPKQGQSLFLQIYGNGRKDFQKRFCFIPPLAR